MINSRDIITTRNDRSQIVDYNNPLFYCFAEKHCYTRDMAYSVSEHWHEDIEFLYVIEGTMEYVVNGEAIHLKAGEGIFVNSKRIHSNQSKKGEMCVFYCAIIHPSYLCASTYIEQKYVAPLLGSNSFDYLLLNRQDWTKQIIDDIEHLFETSDTKTLEIEILEVSFRILRYLYSNTNLSGVQNPPPSIHVNTFKSMMLFIQEHYMEKISLEEIADAGNVGKTLCAKLFKKYASKTPGEYLIQYRITKSMQLLTETDQSITEIAYATGFTSASHYTKTFREVNGCTPKEYRNSNPNSDAGSFGLHSCCKPI